MSAQCKDAADTTVAKYAAGAHIRDFLNKILRDEHNDYWWWMNTASTWGCQPARSAESAAVADHFGDHTSRVRQLRTGGSRTAGDFGHHRSAILHPPADPLYGGYGWFDFHAGF